MDLNEKVNKHFDDYARCDVNWGIAYYWAEFFRI